MPCVPKRFGACCETWALSCTPTANASPAPPIPTGIASSSTSPGSGSVPPRPAARVERGQQEKGTDRQLQERRTQVVSPGGRGQRSRLPQGRLLPGGPLRVVRPLPGSGLDLSRPVGRHSGVRHGCDCLVVANVWSLVVPGSRRTFVVGGRRREQQLQPSAVEAAGAVEVGRPLGAGRDGLPLPHGGIEVEPG